MSDKIKIHLIAAARPNFMKIAPLYHVLKKKAWANPIFVHTGQHYDLNMSDVFFKDLGLPEPKIHLGVGGGTHADQTGKVMMAYEKVLLDEKPDLVIVVGDVNATMACTLAAVKINYPIKNSKFKTKNLNRPLIAHLEAGLRSFDRTMPEEINRLVTDSLVDILWTPSLDADENLLREGVPKEKIIRVGNIMIDSLEMLRGTIENQDTYSNLGLKEKEYVVVTLHRPVNVDHHDNLSSLCNNLISIANDIPLCFPVHPRTLKQLQKFDLYEKLQQANNIILTDPLNYIRFMNLVLHSCMTITDSGGIQEETTYLGIPCLTIRQNTERPVTISQGTNILCDIEKLNETAGRLLQLGGVATTSIEFWDGRTAGRVARSINGLLWQQEISL